ncbi:unnamed protein product, partial [Urochloa humidicola]
TAQSSFLFFLSLGGGGQRAVPGAASPIYPNLQAMAQPVMDVGGHLPPPGSAVSLNQRGAAAAPDLFPP